MRRWWWMLAGVLLLGFGVRLFLLGHQSIWWDEGYSVALAQMSLKEATLATAVDIHPPLYYYLLHFWIPLAGKSEFSVRFLSTVFGLFTVALVYPLGARTLGRPVALLGAIITAFVPFQVAYSQEARMFTMETFLGLLSTYLLLFILLRSTSPQADVRRVGREYPLSLWAAYVVVSALALYADYFTAFVIAFQNVFVLFYLAWLWFRRRWYETTDPLGVLWRWAVAQGCVVILYLPWLAIATRQVSGYGLGNVSAPSLAVQLARLWNAFHLGEFAPPQEAAPYLWGIGSVLIVGLGLAFWQRRTKLEFGLWYILAAFGLTTAAFLVALIFRPFFHTRYLLLATPAYYLLLGLALRALWRAFWPLSLASSGLLAFSFALALNNYFFNPAFAKDDTRAVVAFLEREAQADDLILWQTRHPFSYYYRGVAPAHHLQADLDATPPELTRLAQGKRRLFWVTWKHNDTDQWALVPFLAEKEGTKRGELAFTGYRVAWYDLPPRPTFSLGNFMPRQLAFDGQLRLDGVAFGGQGNSLSVPGGEYIWVSLAWTALQKLETDLKFYAYVRDEKGRLVGQDDRLLYNRLGVRTPYWKLGDATYGVATPRVVPGTPPGQYDIEVGVYEDKTRRPLGVVGGTGPVLIGRVEVRRPAVPPSWETVPMRYPRRQPLGELELLGYTLGDGEMGEGLPLVKKGQGENLPLTLFWQARVQPTRAHQVVLALRDAQGRLVAEEQAEPAEGKYPTSRWQVGEVVMDLRDYIIAPQTPPGQYTLVMGVDDVPSVPLATVEVAERLRQFTVPPIPVPLWAVFDGKIELLGFGMSYKGRKAEKRDDVWLTLKPGEAVDLTLYWRALAAMARSYTVFTHLLDPQSRVMGQKDSPPLGGAAPTTSWVPGQVVQDPYTIVLKPEAPAGNYQVEIGWYDAATGERLKLADGASQVILGKVRVEKP